MSGAKVLNLLHVSKFENSSPQCPTYYSPAGNSDVLVIVVHKNVSEVIVSDVLDSYQYIPIIFHLVDHVRTMNLSDPVEKFIDWEQFQSLASELISARL
jgi:hypothetical protein